MGIREDRDTALRKMALPAAAGALAAGVSLLLASKHKLRDSMPNMTDLGIGDLSVDLRRRLDSVRSKTEQAQRDTLSGSQPTRVDPIYEEHRREREQRRSRRRAKA